MNRTLWIVCTVVWLLAVVPAAGGVMMSFFLFDSPGSTDSPYTLALFFSLLALPFFCVAGAGIPWLFHRSRVGPWLFLIPLLDVAAVCTCFVLISTRCGGMLACR